MKTICVALPRMPAWEGNRTWKLVKFLLVHDDCIKIVLILSLKASMLVDLKWRNCQSYCFRLRGSRVFVSTVWAVRHRVLISHCAYMCWHLVISSGMVAKCKDSFLQIPSLSSARANTCCAAEMFNIADANFPAKVLVLTICFSWAAEVRAELSERRNFRKSYGRSAVNAATSLQGVSC